MNKKVVVIGAGGHAKVIADIIEKSNDELIGFLDDSRNKGEKVIEDYNVIGKISDSEILQKNDAELYFVIAIGNNFVRMNIYENYKLNYYTAIHPTANIGMEVEIGEGTVIMANACINSNTEIGKCCIINTGAVIEHDNIIEDFVHVSPNATLCGTVKLGKYSHVGAGSVIKNNIEIEKDCVIGAGAVVINDIKENGTYVGVPVRKIEVCD